MAVRLCPACRTELVRRPGEKRAEYLSRSYCDMRCSVADRSRKAEERRAAKDRADRETPVDDFDRGELLRAAQRAAPGVAPTRLVAILDAVEPLIAMNVRRRTLAPIAAEVRARRTT